MTREDICKEFRSQIVLILPMLMAQIAQVSLGVADTIMTGRAGALDMAGVALSTSLWVPTLLFGQGVVLAVTPAVAQLRGQGDDTAIYQTLRQSIWLALGMSVLLLTVTGVLAGHLELFGLDEDLAYISRGYLHAVMCGGPAYLLFIALRCSMEGYSRVRPAMVASIAALVVNIPFNYLFIFGKFGFPRLGGIGAGVATAITYWAMLGVMIVFASRMSEFRTAFSRLELPRPAVLLRLFRVGLPGALALLCEVSMFALIALLLAPLGAIEVAGHQVALNFSTLIFIMPLSIGMASTIRVGLAIGKNSPHKIILATRVALGTALVVGVLSALLTFCLCRQVAMLYNPDPVIINLAASLLVLASCYQITDALQTTAIGILRGYNDTKAIFAVTFFCYWIISMPLGWTLGRTDWLVPAQGARGFWIAIIVGLSLAAVCYLTRIRVLEKRLDTFLAAHHRQVPQRSEA